MKNFWLDRVYQFIKTCLLKFYNGLFVGPGNISGENVYTIAANSGYAAMMQSYVPTKHNYFICQEKLRHNAMVLQEDLAIVENWQKASRLDSPSLKR